MAITREQAERVADQWARGNRTPGDRRKLCLYTFRYGFVAWLIGPDDRSDPRRAVKRSIVIDRSDGAVTHWRSLPPTVIAQIVAANHVQRVQREFLHLPLTAGPAPDAIDWRTGAPAPRPDRPDPG